MGIRTRQAAFTLIELLVVLVLVAVFALVGIPSYESMTTTNRMATEINGLMADLQYARSEAIMRGVTVNICASSDHLKCNAPSSGWNAGWIIQSVQPSGTTTLLRVHPKIGSTDNWSSVLNTIAFDRNGFSTSAGTGTANIILNDQAGTTSRRQCLEISRVGQVALASGSSC